MGSLVETIGLVSSVLGIVSFFEDHFASKGGDFRTSTPAGLTTIRVGAALDGPGPNNTGTLREAKGHIGQINLYNEKLEKIGAQAFSGNGDTSGEVREGSYTDFALDCKGQQPTYIQIFGQEDAICIPYITHTWPDGTKRAWSGDIGQVCGVSHWSYSNVIVGQTPDGSNYKPACTWLDWDHNTGIKLAAMQIHISEFYADATTDASSLSVEKFCNPPTMIFQDGHPNPKWDSWSKSYDPQWNGVDGMGKKRRSLKKRSAWMESQLILSADPSHSATNLCQSDNSHSADFVSLDEGVFCDMGTKTLWPLCSTTTTDDCFNKDATTLVVHGERQVRSYEDVQNWE